MPGPPSPPPPGSRELPGPQGPERPVGGEEVQAQQEVWPTVFGGPLPDLKFYCANWICLPRRGHPPRFRPTTLGLAAGRAHLFSPVSSYLTCVLDTYSLCLRGLSLGHSLYPGCWLSPTLTSLLLQVYKRSIDFCVLTSNPATLKYMLISSKGFLSVLLDFLHGQSFHL